MLSIDYLPNIGGLAAHIYHLSRMLLKNGHQIVIVNPIAHNHESIHSAIESGIHIVRADYSTSNSRILNLFSRTRITMKAVKMASEIMGGVDILHQHDYRASNLTAWKNSRQIPWIWTNHTSTFLLDQNRPAKKIFLRISYARTDGIITVSKELFDMTAQLFPDSKQIEYIPNGVDTDLFSPSVLVDRAKYGFTNDDFIVLCPRRMVEKNGVIYLAHAVNQLIKQHPNYPLRFVFLGSEPFLNINEDYVNRVKEILQPAFSERRVVYLGNIPADQMPEVNALADIVIIPSLLEAVSLSALEAMASHKAVIASNVGGLPEIIKDGQTGILVSPREPDELAAAIVKLYCQPELRSEIAQQAYQLSTGSYSWDMVASRTVNFYQKILEAR